MEQSFGTSFRHLTNLTRLLHTVFPDNHSELGFFQNKVVFDLENASTPISEAAWVFRAGQTG